MTQTMLSKMHLTLRDMMYAVEGAEQGMTSPDKLWVTLEIGCQRLGDLAQDSKEELEHALLTHQERLGSPLR